MEAEPPIATEEAQAKKIDGQDVSTVQQEAGVDVDGDSDGGGGSGGKKTGALAPSHIALHPSGSPVFVTVGAGVRGFDLRSGSAVSVKSSDAGSEQAVLQAVPHADAIRAICVDPTGHVMATAGDDKMVNLWMEAEEDSGSNGWICCHKEKVSKRVSAMGFSSDGRWLVFADKFGVVHSLAVPSSSSQSAAQKDGAAGQNGGAARGGAGGGGKRGVETAKQLLGHCCSIITCLSVSHGSRFVATGDRDGKIRVSVFPDHPLEGAHEIQSFCLGHTGFITAVAFVGEPAQAKQGNGDSGGSVAASDPTRQLLLSSAADATVRLWDPVDGRCLQVLPLPAPLPSALAEGASPMALDVAGSGGEQAEAEGEGPRGAEAEEGVSARTGGERTGRAADGSEAPQGEDAGATTAGAVTGGGRTGGAADGVSLAAVAVDSSGCLIAGAIAGAPQVCLIRFDPAAHTLQLTQCITLKDGVSVTSLTLAPDGKLWTVAGAAESLPSEDSIVTPEAEAAAVTTAARIALAAAARVRVFAAISADADVTTNAAVYQVLADGKVPGGEKLLAALQGSVAQDVVAMAGEAAKGAVDGLWAAMKKKEYGEDQRENRKRGRNDKKLKGAC